MNIDRKQKFALLSRFDKLYVELYKQKPLINKYNEQWAAEALIESFGLEQCYDAMSYYFKVNNSHSWKSFANNAGRLIQSMRTQEEDARQRAITRQKGKEWLNG